MELTDQQIGLAKETISNLLDAMGFVEHTVYLDQLESRQILAVSAEHQAILIGRKGENLSAFQTLCNALMRHRDPSMPFITIDIANYRKDRIEKIMRIAEDAAQKVRDYGREFEMRPMNAYERRVVHMVLADKPELETESIGEDPHRKVVVRPRNIAK